jgi:eukaryotic-like serine/threonine-protein kinase
VRIGTQLGPYQVLGALGAGGMGEVFRARDTRLDRDVAIKILPELFSSDPDRLARFEREARTLASLNHPNVAGIHGVEEHGGRRYLILEYVAGETLADRLDRGPLPLDEALDIAVQIARGIEAAHEAGVIHRDLKPGNVMVTPEGQAKVLDFGLARMDASSSSSGAAIGETPTLTSPARQSPTVAGVILGTAAYMSPEQARGRRVDRRTDIWSFGVVLLEMLTGANPFAGETVSDSIGAILHKDADLARLPPDTPPMVRHVLRRCLARDRDQRYRDIGDARLDLLDAGRAAPPPADRRSLAPWMVAAAGALIVVLAGVALWGPGRAVEGGALPLVAFTIEPPDAVVSAPLIAPDGSAIVYRTEGALWLRRLDRVEPASVDLPWPATPVGWTADSSAIIVLRRDQRNELWQVGVESRAPRLVGPLPAGGFLWGASALDDQSLLIGMAGGGLYSMQLAGGAARQLLQADRGEVTVTPSRVPGTGAVLFAEVNAGRIELLRGGTRSVVLERPGDRIRTVAYAAPGFLLFEIPSGVSAPGVWAVPFSASRLEATGDPFRILPVGEFSISSGGVFAYVERQDPPPVPRQLVWVNRRGDVQPAFSHPLIDAINPALSPDGRRIAVAARAEGAPEAGRDLFVLEPATGARLQLADALGNELYPAWRPDGESIVYSTWNPGIRLVRERDAAGQTEPRLLTDRAVLARLSGDGRYLVTSFDAIEYVEGQGDPMTFVPESSHDFDVSSDGRYLAYSPLNRPGVVLRRFPGGTAQTTVTSLDATGVRFARDDSELFFWAEGTFWAAGLDFSGPTPVVQTARPLFTASAARLLPGRHFDPAPDGRFLMVQQPESASTAAPPGRITVIQNWAAEFARATPAGR